ncbi:hypothetical protein E4U47_006200 [Claviceps purpurea]|nr:hypothetical protein E4U47_006200 [Claviceps purpurea]
MDATQSGDSPNTTKYSAFSRTAGGIIAKHCTGIQMADPSSRTVNSYATDPPWRYVTKVLQGNKELEVENQAKLPFFWEDGLLWKNTQILKILPSKHKLSTTESRDCERRLAHICARGTTYKKPKIVDSEKSLEHRQEENLTEPVEFLIAELEHITNLWSSLGIKGNVGTWNSSSKTIMAR